MKKLYIPLLFIFAFASTMSAGSRSLLMAQSNPQAALTSEAGTSTAPTSKTAAQKQSHKDYAEMEIKECSDCHKGEGVAPNHGPFWEREHRIVASKSSKNCADCHSQQFCLDCHQGGGIDAKPDVSNYRANYKPRSHRTDFREIHPIKALDNPQTCTRCHDTRFCNECHSKFRGEDLRVQSHRKGWSDLPAAAGGPAHSTFTGDQCQTCHPGALLPKHVWSSDHAREARRNLEACQACHSEGDVCLTCHSGRRGLKINPHPRNWGSVKDAYRSRSDGRSCVKCHDNF